MSVRCGTWNFLPANCKDYPVRFTKIEIKEPGEKPGSGSIGMLPPLYCGKRENRQSGT